jgi:hypothetical protein
MKTTQVRTYKIKLVACNCNFFHFSDHVSLYGALKRMIEWHYGRVTFVSSNDDISHLEDSPWVRYLHAAVKTSADNLIEDFVWRGRISITDQKVCFLMCSI